jgi:predicted Zn finger-like uncharacterized protein
MLLWAIGGTVAAVIFIFAPLFAELRPRRRKLDLEKILAVFNVTCPHCRAIIPPDKQMRIDFELMRCPECGYTFTRDKRLKSAAVYGEVQ